MRICLTHSTGLRIDILHAIAKKIQVGGRVSVSPSSRAELEECFAEDNRRLLAEHNLEIDKKGWVH